MTLQANQRPFRYSKEILIAAATQLLKNLNDKELPPTDENAIEQLSDAMRSCGSMDGYDICRELDRSFSWQPNASMVEAFDNAFFEIERVHKVKVKEWVALNGIVPQKAIGDSVDVTYGGNPYSGEITNIDIEVANYTVLIPALGHVREGLGTHGSIFKFEDIHPLGEPPEQFELRSETPRG